MSNKTGIEWADATWNPIVGCSIVSKGCTNCYAMKFAHRLLDNPGHPHYHGTTAPTKNGGIWTGKTALAPDHIQTQPLRWIGPRRIFVNSMGDLFHESVPNGWIDRVFHIMALAPQHTFMILTKRAKRMQDYLSDPLIQKVYPGLPFPNLWLGVSIEDQETANERIPYLLRTPAAMRFVSAEPLLGPVNFRAIRASRSDHPGLAGRRHPTLDWIICGGESGPDARPMHPAWPREIRDQCQAMNIPFFFKQWGEWQEGSDFNDKAKVILYDGTLCENKFDSYHPAIKEFINRFPQWGTKPEYIFRSGKKRAGRELDGRTWDQFPNQPKEPQAEAVA